VKLVLYLKLKLVLYLLSLRDKKTSLHAKNNNNTTTHPG